MTEMSGGYVDGDSVLDDAEPIERTGRDGEGDPLDRLESRVREAVRRLEMLREERDGLKERLAEREERVSALEAEVESSGEAEERVREVAAERDRLLAERAAMLRRVETVLERLDQLSFE